jgi:SulP family sulfate permease
MRQYRREDFTADALAAVIVTLMLIPQSLAYALLAGLPAEVGLYASITPLLAYALLGSSRVLAVGPVAVISLMTASATAQAAALGFDPVAAAVALAACSALMLLFMGALRLGGLAQFLSHPVMSAFISASALLIALSQLKPLLGLQAPGEHFLSLLWNLLGRLHQAHVATAALGLGVLAFLWLARGPVQAELKRRFPHRAWTSMLVRASPVMAIAASTALLAWGGPLFEGVKAVGHIPAGLPALHLPLLDPALWQALWMPALLISVVGFVESVSVAQTLAARQRQRIEPNQELLALGGANLASAFSGGLPVTGGFARSVVNFDAGARSPAAGVFTALGIAAVTLWLTPLLVHLPQTTLAATIIVAVLSLVDFAPLRETWKWSRPDFLAALATLVSTLGFGVESGLMAGVGVSLGLLLYRISHPHIAEVGLVPGTEHFRNVNRHEVQVSEHLLGLRMDESLNFANSRVLEDRINQAVSQRPTLRHVVLLCSAVNDIDASALESLETIDHRLREAGLSLHLSEVKGPVMDRLNKTGFPQALSGRIFLTHFQAVQALQAHGP